MKGKLIAALLLLLTAAGCGGTSDTSDGSADRTKLVLVAYSTPREVYAQLTKDFAATSAGKGVSFDESYAASGEQSPRRRGRPARGRRRPSPCAGRDPPRRRGPRRRGLGATTSTAAWSATRSWSSPSAREIRGDPNLGRPQPQGDRGDHAQPVHLGRRPVERWPPTAPSALGKSERERVEYLRRLFRNVSVQDKSAREALQTFVGGKGDVLLAYENEAILAQSKGEELDYVVPDQTILIENLIAVVSEGGNSEAAQRFVDFTRSRAQRVFGEAGYRPT